MQLIYDAFEYMLKFSFEGFKLLSSFFQFVSVFAFFSSQKHEVKVAQCYQLTLHLL